MAEYELGKTRSHSGGKFTKVTSQLTENDVRRIAIEEYERLAELALKRFPTIHEVLAEYEKQNT